MKVDIINTYFSSLKAILICLFVVFGRVGIQSQNSNIGMLPTLNFAKTKYKGGTQTWSISQDAQGGMWFANNGGILNYDGRQWKSYSLNNNTIIRSLAIDDETKRIYVGGQGEFGFFTFDEWGKLHYNPLSHLLPNNAAPINDVWKISIINKDVFFRTDSQIFLYHNNQLTSLFSTQNQLLFSGCLNDKLLIQDKDYNLFQFDGTRVVPLSEKLGFQISDIIPLTKDSTLITTHRNGFFLHYNHSLIPWQTTEDAFFKKNVILCAQKTKDNNIVIGTALNGLIILDANRKITQHFSNKKGLQNNTILTVCVTQKGSVWTGSDNGIDYVDISSAFSTIYPDEDLEGTGYCASIFQNKIYFGTNTGLYVADWKKYYSPLIERKFQRVTNSDGQVWSLNTIDNNLLMGHHEGAFEINNAVANKIVGLQGIWKFLQLNSNHSIAGYYKGIALFKKTPSNHWIYDGILEGLNESSRLLAFDADNKVWMGHPYRGIYKMDVNTATKKMDVAFLGEQNGLPNNLGNHLFQLKSKIYFTTTKDLYEYNKGENRFVISRDFENYFDKNTKIKFLKQDESGNIWYGTNKEVGLLKIQDNTFDKKITKLPIPELMNKLVEGFQFVFPIDSNNVFFATERGFIHFNLAKYIHSSSVPLRVLLSEVKLIKSNDSILYNGHIQISKEIHLKAAQNSLSFAFAAPDYPENDQIQFSHYLKGLENGWSAWSNAFTANYVGLKPGDYTFYLKAKDQFGKESETLTFSFTIAAPWYASTFAYITYILLLLGTIVILMRRQAQQFKIEKEELQEIHNQKEAEHIQKAYISEASILKLKEEKYEAELNHKNQELLSATMHIAQKNELLKNVRQILDRLAKRAANDSELQHEIDSINKIVQQDANIEADWDRFIHNFDVVHDSFYRRLKERYPQLSQTDYKLCVYLRMNLSSKDIATLLNISLRSVETNRYRLRKKLELPNDVNLTDFLIDF